MNNILLINNIKNKYFIKKLIHFNLFLKSMLEKNNIIEYYLIILISVEYTIKKEREPAY